MITKRHRDFFLEIPDRFPQAGGAAFFDRDGTINVDFGHVFRPENLVFVEGTPEIIRSFNEAGVPVIVVTNQAGIAKGLYQEQDMHGFHRYMNEQLSECYGAHIDAFYFCPHHPQDCCSCRKPNPGMFLQAAIERQISLSDSVMFGDKETDRMAAERAGVCVFYQVTEQRNNERCFYESSKPTDDVKSM